MAIGLLRLSELQVRRLRRIRTNSSELHRKSAPHYPLRNQLERAFKQQSRAGNLAGKILARPRNTLSLLKKVFSFESSSGTNKKQFPETRQAFRHTH
jgi:hypothetical protein